MQLKEKKCVVFDNSYDLARTVYLLALAVIRKVRAWSFRVQVGASNDIGGLTEEEKQNLLVEKIKRLCFDLFDDSKTKLKWIEELNSAIGVMVNRLDLKAKNDANLQNDVFS